MKIPQNVLDSFEVKEQPTQLSGGQGTNYKTGNIVLKPIENIVEYEWIAESMNSIKQDGFRVPHYIKSINGNWSEDGWIAYEFIEGEHIKNNWKEKFEVCELFHKALEGFDCPEFIKEANDPWAIADRVVWEEQTVEHHPKLQEQLDKLKRLLKSIDLPNQLIHGDITGNILFHNNLSPAIIDFSPYYRPKDFDKAIIVVDALVWEGADKTILEFVKDISEINQLIIRAEMRRLIEIEECMKYFKKGDLNDIEKHIATVDLICNLYK